MSVLRCLDQTCKGELVTLFIARMGEQASPHYKCMRCQAGYFAPAMTTRKAR